MKTPIFFFLLACFSLKAIAQNDEKAQGLSAFQKKDYVTAESQLKIAVDKNPDDQQSWYIIVNSQIAQDKYSAAIETLQKIAARFPKNRKAETDFLMARSYAGLNDQSKMLTYLNTVIDDGGGNQYWGRITADKVFENYKSLPEVLQYKEGFNKNTYPCLYDEHINQLAFFVGIWDVFVQSSGKEYDRKVSVDSVVRSEGGCSIIEYFDMTPPNNFHGRSFSFYDATANKVRHNWAGSGGDIYNYEVVKASENYIQLLVINTTKTGTHHRKFDMTYDPSAKTIHQYIEDSFDGGKTWSANWDAIFRKR